MISMRVVIVCLFLAILPAVTQAESPPTRARQAIEKGLRRVDAGSHNYTKQRQCFSCHHQAMAIWNFASARKRGFEIPEDRLRQQLEFTRKTFAAKLPQIAKGQAIPGGTTMAVYALASFAAADQPADEITTNLLEYLLLRQRPDGAWPALMSRPPAEGSSFTNTALALEGLRDYGPAKVASQGHSAKESTKPAWLGATGFAKISLKALRTRPFDCVAWSSLASTRMPSGVRATSC